MSNFIIYPKKGDPFRVALEKVDFEGNRFIFYDQYKRPTDQGFLSREHIAAIMPEQPQRKGRFEDEIVFSIYLRRRTEPIEVVAHELDPASGPIIDFYFRIMRNNELEKVKVKDVFIDRSEVIAIVPLFPD